MSYADKSILIVEDTEMYREILGQIVEDMGVGTVYKASDGIEAVRMARYFKPDLVLLDLYMPVYDGFAACEKIRLFSNKITMPIIVISGQNKIDSLERIFDLGANDYLEKPFRASEVTNRVKFYLDYCETLQKLRRYENYIKQDLSVAKSVQINALPDPVKAGSQFEDFGLDFCAYHKSSLGIGGDSWGYSTINQNKILFFILDITGHGVNAALNNSFIMGLANNLLREKWGEKSGFSLVDYAQTLNVKLCDSLQDSLFCVGALFVYDIRNKNLDYIGFGLPDFKIKRAIKNKVEAYSLSGLPMGVSKHNFVPKQQSLKLDDKDVAFFMTDGLVEFVPEGAEHILENDTFFSERVFDTELQAYDIESNSMEQVVRDLLAKTIYPDSIKDDVTLLSFKSI